jgi:hypothetical protein
MVCLLPSEILLTLFLISNFRRVLNIVFFLLGDSPTSEFYMPTFRNTVSSIFICDVSSKNNRGEIIEVYIRENVWLENNLSQSQGALMGSGRVQVEKRAVEGKDPK